MTVCSVLKLFGDRFIFNTAAAYTCVSVPVHICISGRDVQEVIPSVQQ